MVTSRGRSPSKLATKKKIKETDKLTKRERQRKKEKKQNTLLYIK